MAKKHRKRSWPEQPEPLASPIIDNHTHIASVVNFAIEMSKQAEERGMESVPVFSVEELLRKAEESGVKHLIYVGCELPHLNRAVNIAKQYPNQVKAAVAIHPNETVLHGHRGEVGPDGLAVSYKPWHEVNIDEAMRTVYETACNNRADVVAIGETGLDYFRTGEGARQAQIQAFREHIAIAKELHLPLQIHDRDAHEDVINTLLKDGAPEATIFHSYSADADVARLANEQGWYLSFSGTLTYKANERLREALSVLDKSHILIETDAPYLTPEPYRGRTNSSYLTPFTLRCMAEVLDLSEQEIARITYENTIRAYSLPY